MDTGLHQRTGADAIKFFPEKGRYRSMNYLANILLLKVFFKPGKQTKSVRTEPANRVGRRAPEKMICKCMLLKNSSLSGVYIVQKFPPDVFVIEFS